VPDAIIICYVPNEVLHSSYALKGVEVTNYHVAHVFGKEYYVAGNAPFDAHFIQHSVDDRTLDGFALR
jgi:hypothetical protein